jgi:hypothetical protein
MSHKTEIAQARSAAPSSTADYFLCGWRMRSVVPLPEALIWTADDRPPDVTVRFGAMPDLLEPIWTSAPVQMGRDGACRLEFAGIGRFHVAEGREVIVEPSGSLDTPEFRATLLGPILGTLCHQRGLFPLHAACIRIGDGAVAIAGRTGSGKSTLAAAMVRRGHALVADDLCVIDLTTAEGPRVVPSFPRLKLWDDALAALDISADGIPRASSGKQKYHFFQAGAFDPSPVGLRGIYLLDRSIAPEQQDIVTDSRAAAAAMLSREIYRRPIGFHLGHKVALLADALRIAAMIPVFRLPVRSDLSQLGSIAARLEAHVTSLRGIS